MLKPADIILVDSGSSYGKAILETLNLFQKDAVKFGHVLMVVDDNNMIVADLRVNYRNINEYLKNVRSYKIIRNKNISDEQRCAIVKKAESLLNKRYGVFRIVLQLLDQIFDTNFFTRWLKDEHMQICSTLVSWSYYMVAGVEFNNLPWQCVEPDDISDESEKNIQIWEVISEK
jgi:ribosomal protein L21